MIGAVEEGKARPITPPALVVSVRSQTVGMSAIMLTVSGADKRGKLPVSNSRKSCVILILLLCSFGFAEQSLIASASSATIAILDSAVLKATKLAIPPLSEQAAIVRYLNKATVNIDAAIDRARQEIELLGEYRTRLIADVVTGQVDVREAAADLPDEADTLKSLNAMGETDKGNYL